MAKKRNEIIEEQRKARQEFLKLKQMQSGQLEPEAKPSQIEIKPKTFSEKWQNYWYHYKVQTLLAAFLLVIVAIVTVQCATREKYDFSIMYFSFEAAAPVQIEKAEAYFEKYATDIDGNGEVNVRVIDCSFNSELRDMNYRHAALSKVQSIIATEESTVIYLIDESAKQHFENALDYSLFKGDLIKMSPEFYEETTKKTDKEDLSFPKNLMLGLRIIDGTALEKSEEASEAFSAGEELYNKLKKQNG